MDYTFIMKKTTTKNSEAYVATKNNAMIMMVIIIIDEIFATDFFLICQHEIILNVSQCSRLVSMGLHVFSNLISSETHTYSKKTKKHTIKNKNNV